MRRTLTVAVLVMLAFGLAGCASGVPSLYLQADRATFEAVAPVHAAYLSSPECPFDDITKQAGLECLENWDLRLQEAEGANDGD